MKKLIRKHGQTVINVILVIGLGNYSVERGWPAIQQAWFEHQFDFVELAFFLHNVVMLSLILLRRQHEAIDRNLWHQAVAIVAFFSGITFVKAVPPSAALLRAAVILTAIVILLQTACLINLGRSFGIMVSIRKVKTNGLYAIIRHPMYALDILWRVCMLLKNPCRPNVAIFVLSSACYVYRALIEEKYLRGWPEYRDYMQKVRYRFLPGLF
jgi:protein-S-isoprenylcysteine O-methyltransferase Ste14